MMVILIAARSAFRGEDLVEASALRQLAHRARRIALGQPHIRTELGHSFKTFDQSLKPGPGRASPARRGLV